MSEVKFRKPTKADIIYVADNMRLDDIIEVWLSHKSTPLEALEHSVKSSSYTSCVVIDDEPVAILGLSFLSLIPAVGSPWLLGTNKALEHKRYFLKLGKPVVEEMLQMCPKLYNYVHSENKHSIRWLKWIGFKFSDPAPYGDAGAMFCKFELERGE